MTKLDFPDTPAVGDLYGSSGTVWRWDGARWASTSGASGARGVVAFSDITSNLIVGGGAWVDTGAAVTFTAVAGRRYQVSYTGTLDSNHTAPLNAYLAVWTAAGVQLHASGGDLNTNGLSGDSRYWTGSFVASFSGATSLKLRVYFGAGTGNTLYGNAVAPCQLWVEDITFEAGSSAAYPPPAATSAGVVGAGGAIAGYPTNLAAITVPAVSWVRKLTIQYHALVSFSSLSDIQLRGNSAVWQQWRPVNNAAQMVEMCVMTELAANTPLAITVTHSGAGAQSVTVYADSTFHVLQWTGVPA